MGNVWLYEKHLNWFMDTGSQATDGGRSYWAKKINFTGMDEEVPKAYDPNEITGSRSCGRDFFSLFRDGEWLGFLLRWESHQFNLETPFPFRCDSHGRFATITRMALAGKELLSVLYRTHLKWNDILFRNYFQDGFLLLFHCAVEHTSLWLLILNYWTPYAVFIGSLMMTL